MLNIYDYITNESLFKKFEVDKVLFVEYKCMIDEVETGYWTPGNYFTYVLGGKKKWVTGKNEYLVHGGEGIFIKRGAYTAHKYYEEEFCALVIFVPDEFIKTVLDKYLQEYFDLTAHTEESDGVLRLDLDESLSTYFHSVLSYFAKSVQPPKDLLTIKFEELILNIMTQPGNNELKAFFRSLQEMTKVSVRQIMEDNFMFNMSLEEYAKLCARSLSVFKQDFYDIYTTSPGKWLTNKRLDYAKFLIETTDASINDVAFKSGFKNTSHFIRVFRENYGKSPLQHRLIE